MSNRVGLGLACAGVALLAGCNKTPSGQVAAKVNGDEVTLQEVNTELADANLPPTVDKTLAQKAMLQRVIERKLLVDAAKKKGIDKSPDFLSQRRRTDELLLAQAYARQQLAAVPLPSDAEVSQFIAAHPTAFGQRARLTLDQLRFVPPQDPKTLQALKDDHTLDAVAAHLTALGVKFERAPAALDTAQVPPQMMAMVAKLPAGEPFVVPANGLVTVNVIKSSQPIAVDPAQAKQIAVGAWRQQKFNELLTSQMSGLKNGAKITYQNGFGPPPAPPAGAGGAGAPPAAPAQ